MGWDLCPWWGAEEEERFPHPGKPPHQQGNQLGQKERLKLSEEGETAGLWQTGQSVTYTDGSSHSPVAQTGMCVCQCVRAGSWNVEIGEQTQGEDCHWL